jgi:hypothetical protein
MLRSTDIGENLVYETTSERRNNRMGYNRFWKYKVHQRVYMIFISAQDGVKPLKVMLDNLER